MIILNNAMDSHTIVELMNNAIHERSSRSEIVPKGVKAKRIFWNRELNKWYGVDVHVYRPGERIKTSEDYLIVGNLPKYCYNTNRGSCSLRPEIYENLDSPHSRTSDLMISNLSYDKVIVPVKEYREEEKEETSDREEELKEEREKRREEAKERWNRIMGESHDDDDRSYDDE